MLEENKKILDSISKRKNLKRFIFPIAIISVIFSLHFFTQVYKVEKTTTYTTGTIISSTPLTSKSFHRFTCRIKLDDGQEIQTTCYRYYKIGETVRIEKQKNIGKIFNTTNYYLYN